MAGCLLTEVLVLVAQLGDAVLAATERYRCTPQRSWARQALKRSAVNIGSRPVEANAVGEPASTT